MLKNFNVTGEEVFYADVCVIGSGAAGFAAALTLMDSGLKVLVLEGGEKEYNQNAADIHKGVVSGQIHTGIHDARERIVGGTTTKWGGQALPFMKEDFIERKNVNLKGWPISYNDLLPYYIKAEGVLGTDAAVPYNYDPWTGHTIALPGFSKNTLALFVTKWCKIPNFAKQHGNKIANSDRIDLLYNANVVELLPNQDFDEISEVKIKSNNGKKATVKARYIIAAGGAIETTRLFLSSKQFGPGGLGNKTGLAGKFFQDHVASVVGMIVPSNRKRFHQLFDPFFKKGFKYFPRVKLIPQFSKQAGILHASAQVAFSSTGDEYLMKAKAALSGFKKGNINFADLRLLLNPFKISQLAKTILRWKLSERGSSPSAGSIWLEIHSEQEPVAESCITLSDLKDELGMQRVNLNWQISDLTVKTICEMSKLVKKEFEQAGIARVVLDPWIERGDIDNRRWLSDVFHQAGGLIMGSSEKSGVVDSDCRVYGIKNLYVASSAVFPTSSFSNPTMTTIALSIRVADKISTIDIKDRH